MRLEKSWTYYNIHNLIRMRLQEGHISEKSFELFFGPFRTNFIQEENLDLSIQKDAPKIPELSYRGMSYCFGGSYLYFVKYGIHLLKDNNYWILAGKRDLLSFVHPILQMLFLKRNI